MDDHAVHINPKEAETIRCPIHAHACRGGPHGRWAQVLVCGDAPIHAVAGALQRVPQIGSLDLSSRLKNHRILADRNLVPVIRHPREELQPFQVRVVHAHHQP